MDPDSEDFDSRLQSANQRNIDVSQDRFRSPIIRAEDGRVVGITLFFRPSDLQMLGIDTRSTEEILYTITEEGLIHVEDCE